MKAGSMFSRKWNLVSRDRYINNEILTHYAQVGDSAVNNLHDAFY